MTSMQVVDVQGAVPGQSPFVDLSERMLCCVREFLARSERISHPEGRFDGAGRFYLAKKLDCCQGLRSPSRSYPLGHNTHGRTLVHVAHEFGLEGYLTVLKKASNIFKKSGEDAMRDFIFSNAVKGVILETDLGI